MEVRELELYFLPIRRRIKNTEYEVMIKKSTYILQLRTYVRVYIGFFYTVIRHRSPQLRTADSEGITGLQVILPNRYVGTYVGTSNWFHQKPAVILLVKDALCPVPGTWYKIAPGYILRTWYYDVHSSTLLSGNRQAQTDSTHDVQHIYIRAR